MDKKTREAFSLLESLINYHGNSCYLMGTDFDVLKNVSINCFIDGLDEVDQKMPECALIMRQRRLDNKTLKALSIEHGVTQERIRQKEHKAIRMLVIYCKNHASANADDLRKAQEQNARMRDIIKDLMPGYDIDYDPRLKHIEELGLSVRSYNCLARSGHNTLADLIRCGQDLYKIRNLGKRSLKEIREKVLEKWGYELPEYRPWEEGK